MSKYNIFFGELTFNVAGPALGGKKRKNRPRKNSIRVKKGKKKSSFFEEKPLYCE